MQNLIKSPAYFVLILAFSLSIFACEGQSTKTQDQTTASEQTDSEMGAIVDAYLALKDAFVASDPSQTKESAQAFAKGLSSDTGHDEKLAALTDEIINAEEIDDQRVHFESLTEELLKLVEEKGTGGKELYYQYCPMAFDNKGAHWISGEKEIRNPYFGSMMLNCGTVEKKL